MEQANTELLLKKLRKDMIINRVISILSLAVATVILVLCIILFVRIQNFMTMAEPIIEQLQFLDVEALNTTLQHINNMVDTLHLEELRQAIEDLNLEEWGETLREIDMEKLQEVLENINEGADRLEEIGDWFENSPLNFWKQTE